jgi:hypothetical protein
MTEVTSVTDQEYAMAFSGPAIFSNKIIAFLHGGGVRVTFGEMTRDGSEFRAAVSLSVLDAIALRDVLSHVLKNVETTMAKMGAEGGMVANALVVPPNA